MLPWPRTLRYSGRLRPAWRMNQTGVCVVASPRQAARKGGAEEASIGSVIGPPTLPRAATCGDLSVRGAGPKGRRSVLGLEDVEQAVHERVACRLSRGGVGQWLHVEALFDGRQDRRRVELLVADARRAQGRRHHEGRDASARAVRIVRSALTARAWRRHVVPLTAELVVRDDDHRARTVGAG